MKSINDIDSRLAALIEKLIQVQRLLLWDIAKQYNLSPIQTQFIIFLNTHSQNLCKVSLLAAEFDLTKATVSDAVTSLENKGIIKKIRVENDKRSYILQLTAMGKKISKKIENWQEIIIKNLNKIPNSEKESAYIFLMYLIKSLFDNGVITTARMCLTCGNIVQGLDETQHICNITGRSFYNNDVNIDCDNYILKSSR
ncbi:MAG: MarR family winged helix-turn-helix transcriptional regulator [Spirochaetes bacterium]|nr:MarR family winged helix-turn-helix transcriptional regulator [Spirochaetota bacterium]